MRSEVIFNIFKPQHTNLQLVCNEKKEHSHSILLANTPIKKICRYLPNEVVVRIKLATTGLLNLKFNKLVEKLKGSH